MPRLWNANYTKVWLANFMIFFSFMLVMPILPLYLSEQYGAGKHTIGVVLSGYTVTALLARLFSGYIVDTYNRKTVLLLSYGLFATFFLGYVIGGPLILFAVIRTLHGAPFGTTTVSNSTVAIDVLPAERRAEGIGYYGLSNNLATAISPTVGLAIYETSGNYNLIFNNWNNGKQLPDYNITANRDYYFRIDENSVTELDVVSVVENVVDGKNAITVSGNVASFPGMIEVYNINGQRVAAGSNTLSLGSLAKGIYILRATDGKQVTSLKVAR